MNNFETKLLKKKKIDKDTVLKISKNESSNRIFVEFCSESAKLVLQRSFQDTYEGKKAAEDFSKTIKSIKDLKRYFGVFKK